MWRLSVIICTYDRCLLLGQTLQSLSGMHAPAVTCANRKNQNGQSGGPLS